MARSITKVVSTYYLIALMIFLNAYSFPNASAAPVFLSIFLLIPIFMWYRSWRQLRKLNEKVDGRDRRTTLFWVIALFLLAMSVRLPSVLLFGMAYEKTPLIYLTILIMVVIERADISAFGFRLKSLGKSLLYGFVFFALLGGLALILSYLLTYAFTGQMPVQYFDFLPVLSAMPFMTLCVGISEEGLFRGYVQTHLEKFHMSGAILAQAALFGIWHFVWDLSPLDPLGMVRYVGFTFFIGLLFGYFYSKSRNLVPLILAHGLWNSVPSGIVTSVAALEASIQTLIWILPYLVSAALTFLFIKRFVREI